MEPTTPILKDLPIEPKAAATLIPDFLLNCPEFNSNKDFHINDIKCPITRRKVKEYYKIPDEDDDETKKRKFNEYNNQRNEQVKIQEQTVIELDEKLKLAVQALSVESQRSVILEEHSRSIEEQAKLKEIEFLSYKKSTDEKIEKLAQLISQLMK